MMQRGSTPADSFTVPPAAFAAASPKPTPLRESRGALAEEVTSSFSKCILESVHERSPLPRWKLFESAKDDRLRRQDGFKLVEHLLETFRQFGGNRSLNEASISPTRSMSSKCV